MHFIKPNTNPWYFWQKDVDRPELRKRDMELEEMLSSARLSASEKRQVKRVKAMMETRDKNIERTLYDSILYKSPDPRAVVKHKLNSRAPSPPGCPGNGGFDMTFGMGMPDHVGRNVSIPYNNHGISMCTPLTNAVPSQRSRPPHHSLICPRRTHGPTLHRPRHQVPHLYSKRRIHMFLIHRQQILRQRQPHKRRLQKLLQRSIRKNTPRTPSTGATPEPTTKTRQKNTNTSSPSATTSPPSPKTTT